MRCFVAILLAMVITAPLAAEPQQNPPGNVSAQPLQNPLAYVQAGQWVEARAAAAQTSDPVAVKLIDYLRMLAPNAAGATEIDTFMRQNPGWPLLSLMARRRLEAIAVEADDTTLTALCTAPDPVATPAVTQPHLPAPPLGPARGAALLRCAEASADLGRNQQAAAQARDAWINGIADAATEAAFLQRFPALPTAADQWARFQRLAWDDVAAAQRQVGRLDPAHAALAATRLALKSNTIEPVSSPEQDPGAMLDLARAYRKLGQDQAAVALWRAYGAAAQQAAPDHLAAFWTERQMLARQLLQDGDAQGAYDIVAAHGQSEPGLVAEAEFLAGFIALRKLNNPAAAAQHFEALAAASPALLTQSRAFYWLARAQAAMGHDAVADYVRAAKFPMTFYGQLAHRAAGQSDADLVNALRATPAPETGLDNTPITAELARAAVQLIAWGDNRQARPFLLRMDELARTPAERIAIGNYALTLGLPDVTVIIARRLGRDGIIPPMQGWPEPYAPPPVPEPAVSLAIMRQESNFDIGIISPSGARGLMQLMPATARLVAHRIGEPTASDLLTADPVHNMRVGTAYLQDMLEQFGNSLPLAAAAYNAGPHRVLEWLAVNGDPRAGNQSMIDWIEMIPFNETRNYVQRVLENDVVYAARLNGALPPMMAQWSH